MSWITDAQRRDYQEWLDERPECVRQVAEKLPPWNRYRLSTTGHIVEVVSFLEPAEPDGPVTVTVAVLQRNNPNVWLALERRVFGILPEQLSAVEEVIES